MFARSIGIGYPAKTRDEQHDAARDPPPCGHPEQIQQQVGGPCADNAAAIGDCVGRAGERKAAVAFRVGSQDQCNVDEDRGDQQTPRFAHEPGKAR